jgi:uncharacterized membrane protein
VSGFPAGPGFALLSAIGFGVSDFVGGVASRRVAALRVVLVSYPAAMALLGTLAALVGGQISAGALLWGSLGGLSQACGVWWLYAALGAGPISVVSPVAAMLTAGVPVLVGIAMGDRPGVLPAVGIVVALVAVVLLGRDALDRDGRPHRFTMTVAWLTIGSGVGFGLNFVLIHQAPVEARLWPLLFARAAATALVLTVTAVTGNMRVPSGPLLRLALTVAVLDASANVAMILALHAALLSLASVVISLYPAATVVLAITVLGERLTRPQAVGLVLALLAVAMIAAG